MASVDSAGEPLVIPVCYVYVDGRIYTPIDKKPKKSKPQGLKRIKNISANPGVSLLIDKYYEDWRRLYYLIIHGRADLISGGAEYRDSLRALCEKYRQYGRMRLDEAGLPVIRVVPERIVSWGTPGSGKLRIT